MTDDSKKDKANPPQSPQGDASAVTPAIPGPREIYPLEQYLAKVYAIHSELGSMPLWFRGDSDASRPLTPSIFQLLGDKPEQDEIKDCRYEEYQAHDRFLRQVKAIDKGFPDNRVDQLVVMRHHGLLSRLLDWTNSPFVALLFAVAEGVIENKQDSCVWILSPSRLNRKFGMEEYGILPWSDSRLLKIVECAFNPSKQEVEEILPFLPRHFSMRQTVQKSVFTMHGTHRPLNGLTDSGNFLRKIIIPQEYQQSVYVQLLSAGTTWDLLFPDLDGLAAWVNIDTKLSLWQKKYMRAQEK